MHATVKLGFVLSILLSGAGVFWWQSFIARKNVESQVGKEIRKNLGHVSTKLEILATKPLIYKEPDDPNGVAINRLERARNISLETQVYDATLSSLSSAGAAPEITEFYDALGMSKKFEACVLSLDRAEQFPMSSYAWQRTESVKQLYISLFAYGSELLTDRLREPTAPPPTGLKAEIDKLVKASHMEAQKMNISVLQALKARLGSFDVPVSKCEEFTSRLPK